MSRLIIISNRLPFSIEKQGEEIIMRQSSGGLVSAIKSYFEREIHVNEYAARIWVGSMNCCEEDWKKLKEKGQMPEEFSVEAIFPESNAYRNYYNGFSNSTLWPL